MTDCTRIAEWELCEDSPYGITYNCSEHLSGMVADNTVIIYAHKAGEQTCCYMGIHYDTIDGKWWEFEDGNAKKELTDDEAAWCIWGTGEPPKVHVNATTNTKRK
jgi:hypothetical protein